jgi:prophage antirepressor-like protein
MKVIFKPKIIYYFGLKIKLQIIVKQFNGLDIQVYGTYEDPLFKAKDVGDLLGIDQIRKTIQNLDEEDKVIKPGNTVTGLQEQWFLTGRWFI